MDGQQDGQQDGDMTGQDPMSSTAEGDHDPGTAELAGAGSGSHGDADGGDEAPDDAPRHTFADDGPPPEAADETPVSDAVPEQDLGFPDDQDSKG